MKVLGIFSGKDSGLALIDDGVIVYAVNEERFSRLKLHTGFPKLSLESLWDYTGLNTGDIDLIAHGGLSKPAYDETLGVDEHNVDFLRRLSGTVSRFGGRLLETDAAYHAFRALNRIRGRRGDILKEIRDAGLSAPVKFIDHHAAHAYSAYHTSGFSNCLVVTSDGGGDGSSGGVYLADKGILKQVAYTSRIHSAGNFWMYITVMLGMDPWRHGGKVTGLAAYEPSEEAYNALREHYTYSEDQFSFINKSRLFLLPAMEKLKEIMTPFNKAQIAYAAQKVLEETLVGAVSAALRKYPHEYIALSGGTFANVRLNQFIFQIPGIRDGFIHPNMGDGGIALGAAYAAWAEARPADSEKWCGGDSLMADAYLGPDYSENRIEELLRNKGIKYEFHETGIEKLVASAVHDKKVVGYYSGRMEYGPRALGHRSILYGAQDPNVNDWLNKQLKRTEYMPFAPIVPSDDAHLYFNDMERFHRAARFMTVTTDCTARMREKAPAAVHVDGTARPQVVLKEQDPRLYMILKEYGKLSGETVMINTSFNMHEEPIVCTPEDALGAFNLATLDVLAMERFIVRLERNSSQKG